MFASSKFPKFSLKTKLKRNHSETKNKIEQNKQTIKDILRLKIHTFPNSTSNPNPNSINDSFRTKQTNQTNKTKTKTARILWDLDSQFGCGWGPRPTFASGSNRTDPADCNVSTSLPIIPCWGQQRPHALCYPTLTTSPRQLVRDPSLTTITKQTKQTKQNKNNKTKTKHLTHFTFANSNLPKFNFKSKFNFNQ